MVDEVKKPPVADGRSVQEKLMGVAYVPPRGVVLRKTSKMTAPRNWLIFVDGTPLWHEYTRDEATLDFSVIEKALKERKETLTNQSQS